MYYIMIWHLQNGNPLQYSCLENPMDGGAWWAAVHGVGKSRTRLSDFTFFHFHFLNGRVTKSLCTRTHRVGDPFVGIFGNSDLPPQATLFFLSERIWRHAIRIWIGEHGNKTQDVGWCQVIISYRYWFIHPIHLFFVCLFYFFPLHLFKALTMET